MGFFGMLKEKLRSKKRDRLCAALCAIGLDARMAQRGQPEERIGNGTSLGLIEIGDSPIRFVNMLIEASGAPGTHTITSLLYLVPDQTRPAVGYLESVRIKSVPRLGQIAHIRWESKMASDADYLVSTLLSQGVIPKQDFLTMLEKDMEVESNLLERLNQDMRLERALFSLEDDITVQGYPEFNCWAISSSRYESGWPETRQPAPSREKWDCYETIARHLLEPMESEET